MHYCELCIPIHEQFLYLDLFAIKDACPTNAHIHLSKYINQKKFDCCAHDQEISWYHRGVSGESIAGRWSSMQVRDPQWLWNAGQTSPEVQNRGISGPTKRTDVLQNFSKKMLANGKIDISGYKSVETALYYAHVQAWKGCGFRTVKSVICKRVIFQDFRFHWSRSFLCTDILKWNWQYSHSCILESWWKSL